MEHEIDLSSISPASVANMMKKHRHRISAVVAVVLTAIIVCVVALGLLFAGSGCLLSVESVHRRLLALVDGHSNGSSVVAVMNPHRKLLIPETVNELDRVWGDKGCSTSDLSINQGPTAPLPNGIPTYTVIISNTCINKNCNISRIHLDCGWFSSARLVNPRIFKRLRFGNCLVNDGKPLVNGESISFQYANSFPYRLSVSSMHC